MSRPISSTLTASSGVLSVADVVHRRRAQLWRTMLLWMLFRELSPPLGLVVLLLTARMVVLRWSAGLSR